MRWVVVLTGIAGCFSPTPSPGAPCGPGDVCPSGFSCRGGLCVIAEPPQDGPSADAPVDGPDAAIGCSDGVRDGFVDVMEFPTIAGCGAAWEGAISLRAAGTGLSCGDDLDQKCDAPTDACAAGWSICGLGGDPMQLSSRADATGCLSAGPGAFVAAMSHCSVAFPCEYTLPLPCLTDGVCSEPVCCGNGCGEFPGCSDGVYATDTRTASADGNGCNAFTQIATGVLCCRD